MYPISLCFSFFETTDDDMINLDSSQDDNLSIPESLSPDYSDDDYGEAGEKITSFSENLKKKTFEMETAEEMFISCSSEDEVIEAAEAGDAELSNVNTALLKHFPERQKVESSVDLWENNGGTLPRAKTSTKSSRR